MQAEGAAAEIMRDSYLVESASVRGAQFRVRNGKFLLLPSQYSCLVLYSFKKCCTATASP